MSDKHVIMAWPELDISIEIQPNPDGSNRWIYDWYYEHLPVAYLQLHSCVTGDVFYTFFDIGDTLPHANNTDRILKKTQINECDNMGNIHFSYNVPNGLSGGNVSHIGVFYGPCYEDMPGYISGRCIKEDWDKLEKAGNLIHESFYHSKKPIRCVIYRKEDNLGWEEAIRLTSRKHETKAKDPEVRKLIDDLYEASERVRFNCPDEVLRLYKYRIVPQNQGGKMDQAFSTMVFAEGDCRQMSSYQMFMLCRMIDKDFTCEQMKQLFMDTVPLSAEFVWTCGLEEPWGFVQRMIKVLDRITDKVDLRELFFAFNAYLAHYHNWVHFMFPFGMGEVCRMIHKEDVEKMMKMFNL